MSGEGERDSAVVANLKLLRQEVEAFRLEIAADRHRTGVENARLREALQCVLDDNAQDATEDPVGHFKRENAGFYRIGVGALDRVRAALSRAKR